MRNKKNEGQSFDYKNYLNDLNADTLYIIPLKLIGCTAQYIVHTLTFIQGTGLTQSHTACIVGTSSIHNNFSTVPEWRLSLITSKCITEKVTFISVSPGLTLFFNYYKVRNFCIKNFYKAVESILNESIIYQAKTQLYPTIHILWFNFSSPSRLFYYYPHRNNHEDILLNCFTSSLHAQCSNYWVILVTIENIDLSYLNDLQVSWHREIENRDFDPPSLLSSDYSGQIRTTFEIKICYRGV